MDVHGGLLNFSGWSVAGPGPQTRFWCFRHSGHAPLESLDLLVTPCCSPYVFCSTTSEVWFPDCSIREHSSSACASQSALRDIACDSEGIPLGPAGHTWSSLRASLAIEFSQGGKATLGIVNHESLAFFRDRRISLDDFAWESFHMHEVKDDVLSACPIGAAALATSQSLKRFSQGGTPVITQSYAYSVVANPLSSLTQYSIVLFRFLGTVPWHALLRSGWPVFSIARQVVRFGLCPACGNCCRYCHFDTIRRLLGHWQVQSTFARLADYSHVDMLSGGQPATYVQMQLNALNDLLRPDVPNGFHHFAGRIAQECGNAPQALAQALLFEALQDGITQEEDWTASVSLKIHLVELVLKYRAEEDIGLAGELKSIILQWGKFTGVQAQWLQIPGVWDALAGLEGPMHKDALVKGALREAVANKDRCVCNEFEYFDADKTSFSDEANDAGRAAGIAEEIAMSESPRGENHPIASIILDAPNRHGFLAKNGLPVKVHTGDAGDAPWPAPLWMQDHSQVYGQPVFFFRRLGWGCIPNSGSPFGALSMKLSHRHRFIFIPNAKAASTAILQYLGELLCDVLKQEKADHEPTYSCGNLTHWDEWPAANDTDTLSRIWSDYFVFSFVRNVWTRTRSAYTFLNGSADEAARTGQRAREGAPWSSFCKDPAILAKQSFCDGFCYRWKQLLSHVRPQSSCLRTHDGSSAVDFLGRVEFLSEDLHTIVNEVNRRNSLQASSKIIPIKWKGQLPKVNAAPPDNSAMHSWLSDGCGSAIADVYREDVEWLHGTV